MRVNATVVTAAERPDLWAEVDEAFEAVWPEYNLHGEVAGRYFSVLLDRFADLQVLLVDEAGRVAGRGRTIPFRWDGSLEDLPSGIDAAGVRAVDGQDEPTALCALAAEVLPDRRGEGWSAEVLRAMVALARRAGLGNLVAPVRPSWKERYPLIDIGHYARWRRTDGLPFDPWMRVHARLGATLLRPAPRSLHITAPAEEWEAWTGLALPEDGTYIFPGGLAPLAVQNQVGDYWEPNVWMLHPVT